MASTTIFCIFLIATINIGFSAAQGQCSIDKGGCQQICTEVNGAVKCSCYSGYVLDTDGFGCIDYNECTNDADNNCTQICSNEGSGYICSCHDGCSLTGDGYTCIDIDECEDNNSNDCDQNCVNLYCESGKYNCTCNSGWSLGIDGHTCIDVDECESNVCNQTCTNSIGSYTCSCAIGCTLGSDNSSCIDIDECTNGAHLCDLSFSTCVNRHCLNEGGYECICHPGYTLASDKHTCVDNNECSLGTDNCEQICTNTFGSYECQCEPGCTLNSDNATCTDVDECHINNGGCSQICNNYHCLMGRYNCSCNTGYQLGHDDHTCIDINECDEGLHNCEQICINNIGSYTCQCYPGCELNSNNHSCTDIDECAEGTDGCAQNCANKHCDDTRYECFCDVGYLIDSDEHSCNDINECLTNNGDCQHHCVNTMGSYHCECMEGYDLENDNHSCKALPCPTLVSPLHGSISCSGLQVTNETCSFSCDHGYHLKGSDIRLCQPNNTWSGYLATCPKQECSELQPTTSNFITIPCYDEFNSTCRIVCPDGFSLNDQSTFYDQTCILKGDGTVDWTPAQSCYSIPACSPDPCLNGGFCLDNGNGQPRCTCSIYFDGLFCETWILLTPSLPSLSLGVQSDVLTIFTARSDSEIIISVITDDSIQVWPQRSLVIPPNQESVMFKLTGYSKGIHQVAYDVLSKNNFREIKPDFVIVYDTPTSTYFENSNSSEGVLVPGCCAESSRLNLDYCTSSFQEIMFSSSCSWTSSEDKSWLQSKGITFVHSGGISLPLSIVGVDASLSSRSLNIAPLADNRDICGNCPTSSNLSDTCINWDLSTEDAVMMAQFQSLLRTFLRNIDPIIPSQVSISQTANSDISGDLFNYLASLKRMSDISTIEGCEQIQSDSNSLGYVLKVNADIDVNINNDSLSYRTSNTSKIEPLCFALDLCRTPQSPLYISVPSEAGNLLTSLSAIQRYINAGWSFDFHSIFLSSYGINSHVDEWFWDGSNRVVVTLPQFDTGLSVSGSIVKFNGLSAVHIKFSGIFLTSLQSEILSKVSGSVSIDLRTMIEGAEEVIQLESTKAEGFLINQDEDNSGRSKRDIHNTPHYRKGYSIDAEFSQAAGGILGDLVLNENDGLCPVSVFIRVDDTFNPQWTSLYTDCLTINIFNLKISGLTSTITLPASTTYWPTNPNTTIRIIARNELNSSILLGHYLSFPTYNTSQSYMQIDINTNGEITATIYKALLNFFDTIVETDIVIHNGVSFTAQAIIYNHFSLTINGQINSFISLDSSVIDINGDFNRGLNTFFSELQDWTHRTLTYLADFTDDRLNNSRSNRDSLSSKVQELTDQRSSLEEMYDNSIVNYQDALLNYNNLVELRNNKGQVLDARINAHVTQEERNSINNMCQVMDCGMNCQFQYDQIICEREVVLPVDGTCQNSSNFTSTTRYETTRLVEQCQQVGRCEDISGIKWLVLDSSSSPSLLPYHGLDCFSVCDSFQRNESTYSDTIKVNSRMLSFACTKSQYTDQRFYTCSVPDNCTLKVDVEPCTTANEECDHLIKFTLINTASSRVSGLSLQNLLSLYNEYTNLASNVSAARADVNLKALQMELIEQQLNLTIKAIESASFVHQVAVNAYDTIQNDLVDDVRLRDWVQSHISAQNVLQLESMNYSTSLEQGSPPILQVTVRYQIPYLFQTHEIILSLNLNTPVHFLMDYISYAVINDALEVTFATKKRSVSKRNFDFTLPDSFEVECVLLNQFLNYLAKINTTLSATNEDMVQSFINLTTLVNNVEQSVNDIITASASISKEYRDPLQQRQMQYLTEAKAHLNSLLQISTNSSILHWLKPIEQYHQTNLMIGDENCYSFSDCLHIISEYTFLHLVNIPNGQSTTLHAMLPTIRNAIMSIAGDKSLLAHDIQTRVLLIYDILSTVKNSGYWCSYEPDITTHPVPEVYIGIGDTATLECRATSSLPLTYEWLKDGVIVPNATDPVFIITNFKESDSGLYVCYAINDIKVIRSLISHVKLYQAPLLTYVTTQVGTHLGDNAGVRMWCDASSLPFSPVWTWYFKALNSTTWTQIVGETSNNLFINKPMQSAMGWYRCKARTDFGNASSEPLELNLWLATVAVYQYNLQFIIYDTSIGSGSYPSNNFGSGSETPYTAIEAIKSLLMREFQWRLYLNISMVQNMNVWQMKDRHGYYKVSFDLVGSNITSEYNYNEPVNIITSLVGTQLSNIEYAKLVTTQYINEINGQVSLNGTYDIVNNSLVLGLREYLCPPGHKLHTDYILCVPCLSGQYWNGSTTKYRSIEPGLYMSELVPTCTVCPIGHYQSNMAATECLSCPIYYTTENEGATSREECQELCDPGTYSTNGLKPCQSCPSGYYQPLYGAVRCINCTEDVEECQASPIPTDEAPGGGTSVAVIVASVVGSFIILLACIIIVILIMVGVLRHRKKKSKKSKEKDNNVYFFMPRRIRRRSNHSTDAFISKEMDKSKMPSSGKYTDNPVYVDNHQAQEMFIIKSTSERSFSKTETTAVSNIDDLSEIERAIDDEELIEVSITAPLIVKESNLGDETKTEKKVKFEDEAKPVVEENIEEEDLCTFINPAYGTVASSDNDQLEEAVEAFLENPVDDSKQESLDEDVTVTLIDEEDDRETVTPTLDVPAVSDVEKEPTQDISIKEEEPLIEYQNMPSTVDTKEQLIQDQDMVSNAPEYQGVEEEPVVKVPATEKETNIDDDEISLTEYQVMPPNNEEPLDDIPSTEKETLVDVPPTEKVPTTEYQNIPATEEEPVADIPLPTVIDVPPTEKVPTTEYQDIPATEEEPVADISLPTVIDVPPTEKVPTTEYQDKPATEEEPVADIPLHTVIDVPPTEKVPTTEYQDKPATEEEPVADIPLHTVIDVPPTEKVPTTEYQDKPATEEEPVADIPLPTVIDVPPTEKVPTTEYQDRPATEEEPVPDILSPTENVPTTEYQDMPATEEETVVAIPSTEKTVLTDKAAIEKPMVEYQDIPATKDEPVADILSTEKETIVDMPPNEQVSTIEYQDMPPASNMKKEDEDPMLNRNNLVDIPTSEYIDALVKDILPPSFVTRSLPLSSSITQDQDRESSSTPLLHMHNDEAGITNVSTSHLDKKK